MIWFQIFSSVGKISHLYEMIRERDCPELARYAFIWNFSLPNIGMLRMLDRRLSAVHKRAPAAGFR